MMRSMLFICLSLNVLAAQGQALPIPFLTSQTANQSYITNPDESLVYVTGQVSKLAVSAAGSNSSVPRLVETNLSVFGSEPGFDHSGLIPATGVEVRFWQPNTPHIYFKAETDDSGNYVIGLSEGVWVGEACGSSNGFYPAAWQLSIENNKLQTMQAMVQKKIELNYISPGDLVIQHSTVTLTGSGFGCNGSLVFTYSNAVDRCGHTKPVEYDHDVIRVSESEFEFHSDTQLRFEMPELDGNRIVTKHIASVHYEQGNNKSRRVPIGESITGIFPDSTCQGIPVVETSTAELAETYGGEMAPTVIEGQVNFGSGGLDNEYYGGGYNPQNNSGSTSGLASTDFGAEIHLQGAGIQGLNSAVQQVQMGTMELNQ